MWRKPDEEADQGGRDRLTRGEECGRKEVSRDRSSSVVGKQQYSVGRERESRLNIGREGERESSLGRRRQWLSEESRCPQGGGRSRERKRSGRTRQVDRASTNTHIHKTRHPHNHSPHQHNTQTPFDKSDLDYSHRTHTHMSRGEKTKYNQYDTHLNISFRTRL